MSTKKGFTLIEILIVTAIIGILTVMFTFSLQKQKQKGEDARVKSDLERLKIAFEDYYSDNNCYPPSSWFDTEDDCGSNSLAPYLGSVPCNPKTGLPYKLEYPDNQCTSFRLFAKLQNSSDPVVTGTYTIDSEDYNYGVASTNISLPFPNPSQAPAPSVDPNTTYSYCTAIHDCTSYNPAIETCTPSYANSPYCDGANQNDDYCNSVGSCTPLP